ncbi:MAG: squalene--hopene cyclase [Acidobacteria bacterium]|nr:squalene--hopene cyclase [Acidobacteriota bacterium]
MTVDGTLERLIDRLLAERDAAGHWTGELSSSALATAVAVAALSLSYERPGLVAGGLGWLERHRNADGGWGDTVLSAANISTTALGWAAFAIAGRQSDAARAAGEWMRRAAGSLAPERLAEAVAARYGDDRTFSVPILTVLAVAGLVPWRSVPQLPFELAACPQSWFRWLRLPVVSYALPALIAIGQVRHRALPSRNPAARLVRAAASGRSLEVLARIQPENGGFLEAVPLTAFVAMSLRSAGYHRHPVLRNALDFLAASARPDGSWPIDTNLATWVTTLSVNALRGRLPAAKRPPLREWILRQQFRDVHPYTGAAPGGWAWTDLPGGVPDADDTAGALLALRNLASIAENPPPSEILAEPRASASGSHGDDERVVGAAVRGVRWLLDLQNRDGGIPTFCRGWGRLPFDRSSPDITAHALLAWAAWKPRLAPALQTRVAAARRRATAYLARVQRPSGAWVPLWFGNQWAANDENPVYGTSRVLRAIEPDCEPARRAEAWLLAAQNADGGWGGDRGLASSIEETSLAVAALAGGAAAPASTVKRGLAWLVEATRGGETTPPSPIGFYFARLWYYERLYPLIFAIDALSRAAGQPPQGRR